MICHTCGWIESYFEDTKPIENTIRCPRCTSTLLSDSEWTKRELVKWYAHNDYMDFKKRYYRKYRRDSMNKKQNDLLDKLITYSYVKNKMSCEEIETIWEKIKKYLDELDDEDPISVK